MRVGRLLRSSEGVGAGVAQGHRVAGSQGHFHGVAGSRGVYRSAYRSAYRAGKQAGWWRRGTNGAARLTRADTTCDETMVAWRASRRQAWRRQAWRIQARRRQARVGRLGARRGGPGGARGGTSTMCVLSLGSVAETGWLLPARMMSSEAVPKNANKYGCMN